MNIVATICARGGSKSIPGKNVRLLCGKPLIVHTVEVAQKCRLINRIIVSTDDPKIAELASTNGAEVPFMRPKELASDAAPKLAVIQHAIQYLETKEGYIPDIIVDLDPTSPLRTKKDIEACIKMIADGKAENVFSVIECRKNPYFNMVEVIDGRVRLVKPSAQAVVRRQDALQVYEINASIYVWKRDALMNNDTIYLETTALYVMPKWAIDIDNEIDFEFMEFIMKKSGR